MKVLITGGAGFIGSHTADRLLKEGYEVRVLDSLQKPIHNAIPEYLDERVEFMAGSATDIRAITEALQGVDYVCLLYTSPSPRDNRVSRMPSSA